MFNNFICRTVIQENIDVIRLQREVKEKSTKLTALQAQFASLEEVHFISKEDTRVYTRCLLF